MACQHDAAGTASALRFRRPHGESKNQQEEVMEISRRTAGLGLLVYGIGTPVAFMSIGSPGGDYDDGVVTTYMSSGHSVPAFALAYLGAFAALGVLPFAARMRTELRSGGDVFWGLAVAGTAAATVGWFLIGGVAVVFAEGGSALASLPHPVVYALSELGILVAVCASAFLVGSAALLSATRATLPAALRVTSVVGGICGLLAAFFFPVFLFWIWAIGFGLWVAATAARESRPAEAQPQPI
jgi:hypothetical protein